MAKQKEAWDKLSMQEKALLIKLSVDNGVSSLKLIRDTYNLYSNGGQKEVLDKVNSSNANFVQRLKDSNRKSIPDWESPTDRISTHKLSVGTDENGNHYIFPEVQDINGELIDFTRPPYHRFAGEISAEMRGDTVRVPSIEEGIKFTETYKQYYPFNNGGNLVHKKSGEEEEESQDLNYPNGVIRQGKLDIFKKIVQSPVGAFTRFIDPTGILSIPDAYYDLKHLVETPTTQRTTADYVDAVASIVGLFPLGNNISDFVKVKNWRQGLQLANKYAEHLPFKLVGVYPDMYLYHNQKSTGGPLYPFSFEKNPFLKTPVVRYDEGGEMVNINLPEVTVFPEETYITYTGNESKSFIPTKEEYNEFKANEIRRQALVNMNNRNTPNVPYINNDPAKPGNSCLYTFLSNYPVPLEKSNRVFWELSPEESGFKRVDTALPGDGIQVFSKPQPHRWGSYFWPATHLGVKLKHGYRFPSHMTMFKDINTNGVLIRGSNGSTNPIDTSAIVEERKPISYIHPYNADIYRFVGTKKLQKAWEKEYNNIYKHGNN